MSPEQRLAETYLTNHPMEAAHALERLTPERAAAVLANVPGESAAGVVTRMTPRWAGVCLQALTREQRTALLTQIPPAEAALIFRMVSSDTQQNWLEGLSDHQAAGLRALLRFPPGTAGFLMDPRAPAYPLDLEISEWLKLDHTEASTGDGGCMFILDREHRLRGRVPLWRLIKADPQKTLESLMDPSGLTVSPWVHAAGLANSPAWSGTTLLPVVDEYQYFLGALRLTDLQRHLRQALTAEANPFEAAAELGRLYWMGLSGVFGQILSGTEPHKPLNPPPEDEHRSPV